jgi:hypothetical protein
MSQLAGDQPQQSSKYSLSSFGDGSIGVVSYPHLLTQ